MQKHNDRQWLLCGSRRIDFLPVMHWDLRRENCIDCWKQSYLNIDNEHSLGIVARFQWGVK